MTPQEQINIYRQLHAKMLTQEVAYEKIKYFSLGAIKKQIAGFHELLKQFTVLHEDFIRNRLNGRPVDEDIQSFETATATCVDKIQFVYLIQLSLKEGRKLNTFNVLIAAFAIVFGLVCTVGSLWWAKVDGEPGQQQLNTTLKNDSLQLKQLARQDSLILKRIK